MSFIGQIGNKYKGWKKFSGIFNQIQFLAYIHVSHSALTQLTFEGKVVINVPDWLY